MTEAWRHSTELMFEQARRILGNCGYRYRDVEHINKQRYQILKGIKEHEGLNILLVYKSEWFLKFGELLKHQGAMGIGETINKSHLLEADARGCRLIIRIQKEEKHPMKLYVLTMETMLKHGIEWTTKEPVDVVSISIHAFRNLLGDEFLPVGDESRFERLMKVLEV